MIKKSGTGNLVIEPEVLDIAYLGGDRYVVEDLSPVIRKTIEQLYEIAEDVRKLYIEMNKKNVPVPDFLTLALIEINQKIDKVLKK